VKGLKELDAYLTGELDDAAADAFEEAMFDAPDDEDVAFVDRLAKHGAYLASHDTFDMGVTHAQIEKLRAEGLTIHMMDAGDPGTSTLVMSRTSKLLATRLPIGRPDLDRVDVEVFIIDHGITKIMRDVLVDKSDGSVIGLCERPLAEIAQAAGPTITKVRECTGARTVIAEWRIDTRLEEAV
jgi:hypothetical protein